MTTDDPPPTAGASPDTGATAGGAATGAAAAAVAVALRATGGPAEDGIVPFGPYAGHTVREVAVIDPAYLADLVVEGVGPSALRAAAARALLCRWPARRGADAFRPGTAVVPPAFRPGTAVVPPAFRPGTAVVPPASARGRVPLRAAAAGALTALLLAGLGALRSAVWPAGPPQGTVAWSTPAPADVQAEPARVGTGSHMAPSRPARPTAALPPGTEAPCGGRVPGSITAAAAHDAVGTHQGVEFRVVAAKDTGRVTFLNSHEPYQGHFYVAVFPGDYDRFPRPPAELFSGRCIVVQGAVELYRGTPQIVLRSPDDVRILDDRDLP